MHIPQINDMVSVSDLMGLNTALRKSAEVGYQTPAGMSSGSMSPLVPQSIEGTLASATYSMKELVLWPAIAKKQVTNTVHEYNVINDHGMDLEPFIAEGSAGVNNKSTYERKNVKIKYLAERREVTDVATMVGIISPNANALAEETQRGTLRLLQKLERSLFHGDETMNPLAFDGILKQARAGGNITDMRNESGGLTADLLQSVFGELYGAPNYGRPDCLYVEPRVHQKLIRETVQYGRHDQLRVSEGSKFTFGARDLSIMAPWGAVPVKSAPFLFTAFPAPASGSGGADAPATPTLVAVTTPASAGTGAPASELGDYIYKVVAVSAGGYSAPLRAPASGAATLLVAGDDVDIDINDAAAQAAAVGVKSYRVYRSEKNGAESTCTFLFDHAVNTNNAAGTGTQILDTFSKSTKHSSALAVSHDPSMLSFVRLLDFMRRPLAEIATSKPFLLMLFGAPVLSVPKKSWVIDNITVD
jgi:hypothetical protein